MTDRTPTLAIQPSKQTGTIVAFRADRLGARLIAMVNTLRLAAHLDVPGKMYWTITGGIGVELNDINELFDSAFTDKLLVTKEEWVKFRQKSTSIADLNNRSTDQMRKLLQSGRDIRVETAFGLICLTDEDPADVARQCRDIFLGLPFAAPLMPLLSAVRQDLEQAVAYHIRRGDLVSNVQAMNKSWPHKFVPEAYYHAHMAQEIAQNRTVIVFSDEAETIATAKAKFPGLKTVDDYANTAGLTQSARDFFELYAMSACAKIIAPEASAFSTTAADLGGAARADVKADMPDARRAACSEALYRQLRDDPDALGATGIVGQTLPHAYGYLLEQGRTDDALALYDGFTARNMPISFLYSQQIELLLASERYDDILTFAEGLERRPMHNKRDRDRCLVAVMVAQSKRGQHDACRRTMLQAFAQSPQAGELKKTVPRLLLNGGLDAHNFMPYSADVVFGFGKRLGLPGADRPEGVIYAALTPAGADRTLPQGRNGTIEPIWWDFSPFLNGNPVSLSERKGLMGEVASALKARGPKNLSPDEASTLAMITAHQGQAKRGMDMLQAIGPSGIDNAMVQHRSSYICQMLRDWKGAAQHVRAAVQISDAPGHLAWAGVALLRERAAAAETRDLLTTAIAAPLPFFAVPLALGQLERREKNFDAALAALDHAFLCFPNATEVQMEQAELHMEMGNTTESKKIFHQIWQDDRLRLKSYRQFARLLIQDGELATARAVIDEALLQKPDRPDLLALRKQAQ